MKSLNKNFFYFLLILLFEGCLTAGTHGSIKSYEFATDKLNLQKAIKNVIATNKLIQLDTIKNYMIDITNGRHDTIFDNHYNDGDNYVTFHLKVDGGLNEYTIHYVGDKASWDTAKKVELSIVYAYDKNGKGGSEGNGGIKWYNWALKENLLKPFEREFISKVNNQLNLSHLVSN